MASKREPRALRELRSLMPWNWDARVGVCPPGKESLRDFTEMFKSCDPLAAKDSVTGRAASPEHNRHHSQHPQPQQQPPRSTVKRALHRQVRGRWGGKGSIASKLSRHRTTPPPTLLFSRRAMTDTHPPRSASLP